MPTVRGEAWRPEEGCGGHGNRRCLASGLDVWSALSDGDAVININIDGSTVFIATMASTSTNRDVDIEAQQGIFLSLGMAYHLPLYDPLD